MDVMEVHEERIPADKMHQQYSLTDYEYDPEKQCTFPEFYRKYKDSLPLLVIVTEGFYGETKYDDYANDQIIRIHRPSHQLRALARLASDAGRLRDEFLSIPVDGKYKFAVVKSSTKVGDAQTMEEILAENNLPIQVRYASYNVELRSTLEHIKGVNILIMKTYVEDFLQGNCLEDGVLTPIPALMALSPEISVAIITGYTNKPKEAFRAKLRSMDVFVEKNVKFKDNEGSPDLTKFERSAAGTGTGNTMPKDLLPRDYTHGDDCNGPPPKLMPRKSSKMNISIPVNDDIYEPLPEPDPNWKPSVPKRPTDPQTKPPLPARPYEGLVCDDKDQYYQAIEADDIKKLPTVSDGDYTYIAEGSLGESGYDSSKDSWSWSAGSSKSYVTDKSVQEIQDLLKTLNLSKYCKEFEEQLVDGAVLQELNEEVLRNDFKFMHVEAVRLMKYVRAGHIPK